MIIQASHHLLIILKALLAQLALNLSVFVLKVDAVLISDLLQETRFFSLEACITYLFPVLKSHWMCLSVGQFSFIGLGSRWASFHLEREILILSFDNSCLTIFPFSFSGNPLGQILDHQSFVLSPLCFCIPSFLF